MQIFQTERLYARSWKASDLPFAIELWGDPEVTLLIDRRGQLSKDQIEKRLHAEIETQNRFGVQYWPLFEIKSEQFVGCCGLRPWASTPNEKNFELGFHIVKRHWGKGYATEAAKGAIKYGHDKLHLIKLYAGHHPQNASSKKILLKLGFQHIEDVFYEPTGLYHPSYILDPITRPFIH
jgi:RimJ/RimL family protein N-acetyltransferase